jgi:hypothetical protein
MRRVAWLTRFRLGQVYQSTAGVSNTTADGGGTQAKTID